MSQQHPKQKEEDEDNSSFDGSDFVQIEQPTAAAAATAVAVPEQQHNGHSSDQELKLKMLTLESNFQVLQANVKMLEATIKLLEQKQIHEKKYGEFEAKMGNIEKLALVRVRNPHGNHWNSSNTKAQISEDGLTVTASSDGKDERLLHVYAEKGFSISAAADEEYSPTLPVVESIVYYFEVKRMPLGKGYFHVGLSDGSLPDGENVGFTPNSYANRNGINKYCYLSRQSHDYEWTEGAIKPAWNGPGDVVGCGILMDPRSNLSIFFTKNGILMGKQIPIASSVDVLYPTISMKDVSLEVNFGNIPGKPFKYDIGKWPGLIFQ